MKKRISLLVSFILILLSIVSCGKNKVDYNKNIEMIPKKSKQEVHESNTELRIDGKITEVSISKSKNFMKINTDFTKIFKDEDTLKLFKNIIISADRVSGIVDLIEPQFYLEVTYNTVNKQDFHLWLEEELPRGLLMKTEDIHTIYTIPEEMKSKLIELIK